MTSRSTSPATSTKTGLVVIGVFAALAVGVLTLFTLGEGAAIFFAILILGGAIAAVIWASDLVDKVVLGVLVGVMLGSVIITGYGVVQILVALAPGGQGTIVPPDPSALLAASDKLDASAGEDAFYLELSESELNAVLQEALAKSNNPFGEVVIDITNATGEPGRIDFTGEFKNGSVGVEGTLSAFVEAGVLRLEILAAGVGMFSIPAVGRSAIEDMITDLADLHSALVAEGADVQSITVGDDRIVVTGTNRGDGRLDSSAVLAGITSKVDVSGATTSLTARFPPGRVTAANGRTHYAALGDSLAANVGVDDPLDGYVSRFHRQLELRDGASYGLIDFGVTGETSGTLLFGGQLDAAVGFGAGNDVSYITIDVGANDLLGHVASLDCSADFDAPACTARLEAAFAGYASNIAATFERLRGAFPEATILLLTAYNPFSFGFEDRVTFEQQSNEAIDRLNGIAALAAAEYDIIVANGFGPMQGTVTATTHMIDDPPDIHPNALGYDVLTGALLDALG